MGAAKERISSIAKFYMLAQKEKGDKWAKLMVANADKIESVKLYKKSHKGNYFEKEVTGKDWKSDKGYTCRAVSSAERQQKSIEGVQKLNAVMAQFPDNPVMRQIYNKKVLEFADVNPDEIKQVMEFEEQKMQMMAQQPAMPDQLAPEMIPQDPMQLTQPQNAF